MFRRRIGTPAPIRRSVVSTVSMRSSRPGSAGDSDADSIPYYNPFVSHAFFSALEASGSACARTGWGPRHLLAKVDGSIAGIVPCYLKSHSQGEYVFDRGWADAYERAGGRYYPKLQASVPFTPATGPRLLIRDDVDHDQIGTALASGLVALCGVSKASSAHVTFAREAEWKFLAEPRLPAADRPAVPLAQPGFCAASTTSSPPSIRAIARRSSASGARRSPTASRIHCAHRQRHHRGRLGRVLRLLHGDRLAQMGPAVSRRARSFR